MIYGVGLIKLALTLLSLEGIVPCRNTSGMDVELVKMEMAEGYVLGYVLRIWQDMVLLFIVSMFELWVGGKKRPYSRSVYIC